MEVVYFLRAEHSWLVKIGWTANIVQRVQKLRLACPHDVTLLGVRPGPRELELAYHEHFSQEREHAEWFKFDRQVQLWMLTALRATYSDAWAEVERLFKEQAPELLNIENRCCNTGSVLRPGLYEIDAIEPRRTRRPPALIEGGGDE